MLGELTKDQIEDILKSNVIGRLGCCSQQKMYVVPVTYCYDGEFVFGHTVEGMKVKMLRENPACCLEVDIMKNMTNWKSVIAWGTFEELKDKEAEEAMEKLITRLAPLMPSETSHPPRMGPSPGIRTSTFAKNPIIYRIRLTEKSGRFEEQ
ncbi:pyridoxamine 5'-phosphate oxidase family protein [Chryseolinea sp. H1M3-3]|uniref:pyridoxamine 5'-phosphate oxidase family protein n=1 Tax=Chryseolinea sp. H1M3-3 TaxID=3034144 RepID=UPI0023EAF012|nr:pyridoxamine 5'-phosphate oxidase family protein [Chryseolinea sp. H1M3-3]